MFVALSVKLHPDVASNDVAKGIIDAVFPMMGIAVTGAELQT